MSIGRRVSEERSLKMAFVTTYTLVELSWAEFYRVLQNGCLLRAKYFRDSFLMVLTFSNSAGIEAPILRAPMCAHACSNGEELDAWWLDVSHLKKKSNKALHKASFGVSHDWGRVPIKTRFVSDMNSETPILSDLPKWYQFY